MSKGCGGYAVAGAARCFAAPYGGKPEQRVLEQQRVFERERSLLGKDRDKIAKDRDKIAKDRDKTAKDRDKTAQDRCGGGRD